MLAKLTVEASVVNSTWAYCSIRWCASSCSGNILKYFIINVQNINKTHIYLLITNNNRVFSSVLVYFIDVH